MSYFLTLLVILSESTILFSLIFYSLFVLTLFEREILGAACCREIVEPFNARKIFFIYKNSSKQSWCRVCECVYNFDASFFLLLVCILGFFALDMVLIYHLFS